MQNTRERIHFSLKSIYLYSRDLLKDEKKCSQVHLIIG